MSSYKAITYSQIYATTNSLPHPSLEEWTIGHGNIYGTTTTTTTTSFCFVLVLEEIHEEKKGIVPKQAKQVSLLPMLDF